MHTFQLILYALSAWFITAMLFRVCASLRSRPAVKHLEKTRSEAL